MNEQDFLDAIAANPNDARLRMVFADWLEERGDVRSHEWRKGVTRFPVCRDCIRGDETGLGDGYGFNTYDADAGADGYGHGYDANGFGDGGGDGYTAGIDFRTAYGNAFGDGQGAGNCHDEGYGDGYDFGYGNGDGGHAPPLM